MKHAIDCIRILFQPLVPGIASDVFHGSCSSAVGITRITEVLYHLHEDGPLVRLMAVSVHVCAGVFHVELKYTSRGARLIEVNARMGGGPVRDTNLLVWGVDLIEQQLLASCGIPCCPGVAPEPLRELAELSVNAKVRAQLPWVNEELLLTSW